MNKTTLINTFLNNLTDVTSNGSFNFDREKKFKKLYRKFTKEQIFLIDESHPFANGKMSFSDFFKFSKNLTK